MKRTNNETAIKNIFGNSIKETTTKLKSISP